jgi:hypothetical protein
VQEARPSSGANEHQALVHYNPSQPGQELGVALILIEVLKCGPISILCLVLCVAPIPQNTRCQTYTPMMMTSNQFPKGLLITLSGGFNKVRISVILFCSFSHSASILSAAS